MIKKMMPKSSFLEHWVVTTTDGEQADLYAGLINDGAIKAFQGGFCWQIALALAARKRWPILVHLPADRVAPVIAQLDGGTVPIPPAADWRDWYPGFRHVSVRAPGRMIVDILGRRTEDEVRRSLDEDPPDSGTHALMIPVSRKTFLAAQAQAIQSGKPVPKLPPNVIEEFVNTLIEDVAARSIAGQNELRSLG
jgi:hypothetical protein